MIIIYIILQLTKILFNKLLNYNYEYNFTSSIIMFFQLYENLTIQQFN